MRHSRTRLAAVCLGSLLAACGGSTDVTLTFQGVVGGEPARCGGVYSGIGTTASELTLADFRLYVHDVRLVTEDGREVPVDLEQDGVWQYENVALLDFENADGCEAGTTETRTVVVGVADDPGPFAGVRFRLGVPFELNHADASTAPPPLNLTSLFWNWRGGYKFFRMDGRTTGQPMGYGVHLGSTACDGDARGNVTTCGNPNRPEIVLDGFDPEVGEIQVDLAALLSGSDVDSDLGGMPGCLSGVDDMDCAPIFEGFGITGQQRLFRPILPD